MFAVVYQGAAGPGLGLAERRDLSYVCVSVSSGCGDYQPGARDRIYGREYGLQRFNIDWFLPGTVE